MLSSIKEKAQGWIAWLIVIFISIPFALWGINTYFEAQSTIVVAEVNGTEIDNDAYQSELNRIRYLLTQQNPGTSNEQLESLAFRRTIVERMVDSRLLAQAAADEGFRISDAQLNEFIRGFEGFQQDGKFSRALYESYVRSRGYRDPTGLEAEFRSENQMQQLMNGFTETAFVTPTDRTRLLRLQAQKREFDWTRLDPAAYQGQVEVAEADISAWYEEHQDDYRKEERVKVAYLRLSAEEVASRDAFKPTEQELRQAYQLNLDRFVVEQRRARHILLAAPAGGDAAKRTAVLEKARELIAQLRGGADFAALAAEYSDDPGSSQQGGDLGFLRRGASEPEFDAALFALGKGAVSDPVETRFGVHVIRLDDVSEIKRSFDEVRDELEKEVRTRKAEGEFFEESQRFEELVYDQPHSLEPAAEALGLKIQETGWFGREGGTGVAATPAVVEAAFSEDVLRNENNSATIEMGTDDFVALRLVGHEAPEVRPLTEVHDRIETLLRTRKAREQAVAEGEKLLAELRGGATLADVAAARGLKLNSPGLVGRRHAGTDFRVLAEVFRLPHPAGDQPVHAGVDLGEEGYALIALRGVQDGDPASVDPALAQAAAELLVRQRGYGQFLEYRKDLREEGDVTIHEDRL